MTAPHAVPTPTDALLPRALAERALEDALTMPPRYGRDYTVRNVPLISGTVAR